MGKTITTHLIEGTPKGLQSIQISNRNIKAFVIPRADLKKAKELEELVAMPCLYILLEDSDQLKKRAYIGQTDDFLERIYQHNKNKNFWDKALVFISQAGTLNKADILYLEYIALNHAKEKGVYNIDENKQNPKEPKLQRHTKDTLDEFFEEVIFITNFRGIDIFKSEEQNDEEKELFYISSRKSDAQGFYSQDGFTVLKGSILAPNEVKSFINKEKRQKFLEEFTEKVDDKIVLKVDYTFSSPSTASSYCIGSNTNGWDVWKTKEGKTLDAIFRSMR